MKNQPQLFEHQEFGTLEVLMLESKPYFPATVCGKLLGYSNPQDAVRRHCKPDGCVKHAGVSITTNQHGTATSQPVEKTYISEGNLYRLIIRSKLPTAERFERFVFDEVLPSIRQHGAYINSAVLEKMLSNREYSDRLLETLAEEREKTSEMESRVAELAPKAQYYDDILQCEDVLPVSVIAKDYGMSATLFNKLLHALGVQYRIGGTWLLYQKYADQGYTVSRTYQAGFNKTVIHTCWTQRGRSFLYDTLRHYGIIPLVESETTVSPARP